MSNLFTITLAAGQGKRMKSRLPKVLHEVAGKPMLSHVLEVQSQLKPQKTIVVVSKNYEQVKECLEKAKPKISWEPAVQKEQRGTGDAVKSALSQIKNKAGTVVVLNGDIPLIQTKSLKNLLRNHQKNKAAVSLITLKKETPGDFGRIVRDNKNQITGIVEFKDATFKQKQISEVNVGIYVFDLKFLKNNISNLKTKNKQKEYYLTDLIELAFQKKLPISSYTLTSQNEALGVNSQKDLVHINQIFYKEQRQRFSEKGVFLLGSDIFIDANVKIKAGVRIESPCYLKGQTQIGAQSVVQTGCVLQDAILGDEVLVKPHTVITESKIAKNCEVGPFAHIRPQTELLENVKIGNFVEIKKTKIGKYSKANHLTYLGDAVIGESVNVGAGTITCNYDGKNKFKTHIKDKVFIGSDSQLVAPVTIGKGAFVAAGTTVTKNVKNGSLVLSRVQQVEKVDWAKKQAKSKS